MSLKRVVAITGCDSGLGWAMAARSAREGIITVAGVHKGMDTEAACALKNLSAHPYQLDVTDTNSIAKFKRHVMTLLEDNPSYKLYALVNNAGVMTIGNYEWQTPQMIENTINVNLLGAMRMVSAFLPNLRQSAMEFHSLGKAKPRIINVASHCGLQALPAFGPYSASKAGLLSLTQSLRLENRNFGLPAIAFLPGGFIGSSNLMSNQLNCGEMMLENLNEEQKTLYEDRIRKLNEYLEKASDNVNFDSVKDENIIETFVKALNDDVPENMYKVENWRYKLYYNLFKLPLNETTKCYLFKRFLNFP